MLGPSRTYSPTAAPPVCPTCAVQNPMCPRTPPFSCPVAITTRFCIAHLLLLPLRDEHTGTPHQHAFCVHKRTCRMLLLLHDLRVPVLQTHFVRYAVKRAAPTCRVLLLHAHQRLPQLRKVLLAVCRQEGRRVRAPCSG